MASRLFTVGAFAASITQVMASCAYGTHLQPRAEEGGKVKVNNFAYTGANGPLNWVALDPTANALCATGTTQSPIDMTAGAFNILPGTSVNLQIPDMAETEFENLGTTVEVVAKGGSMQVGGTNFTLQQFHFHLPSEHLDDGKSMAMEMHMVFEGANQEIAVIGTYIDVEKSGAAAAAPATEAPAAEAAAGNKTAKAERRSKMARRVAVDARAAEGAKAAEGTKAIPTMGSNPIKAEAASSTLLENVFSKLDAIKEPGTVTKVEGLNMQEAVTLLSAGNFQSYMGSLTTPPCSEGVQWLVSTQRLMVQPQTFNAVRDVIGFNSRFPQNSLGQANIIQVAQQTLSKANIAQPAAGAEAAAPVAAPAKEAAKEAAAPAKEAAKEAAAPAAAPAPHA